METVSKAQLKKYASLADRKGRQRAGLFAAEGTKCVCDLARRYTVEHLYALPEWLAEHGNLGAQNVTEATPAMLRSLTFLVATPPVIACFRLPLQSAVPQADEALRRPVLALDCIQDPGNMGTIIRTADWMGIRTIIASPDCVDVFNPKTVQASMGALAQVDVFSMPLEQYLQSLPQGVPVMGTFLDGTNVYNHRWSKGGVLVMGNEGKGISKQTEQYVTERLLIPPVGEQPVAESLNVAIATAMILGIRQSRLE